MTLNLIQELEWRGLIHDKIPGIEDFLNKEPCKGYVGFDPTADSLHIGNLVPIMLLVHLQRAGHQPVALVGGATGMVGDPSGKSQERNLLDEKTLNHNLNCVKHQLEKFLDFESENNQAIIVNNYDWFKNINFLDFIRDVGKHISVNYMMAKDSVKNRLETGMSFTEFSYQLVQGYDFYWLWKNMDCRLQMGGSDQWGNMVTGTELIRRKGSGEAYALTAPLVKKADGGKFGKTEEGNIWLDPVKTSPYKFYQFWLNTSDDDAITYIKIFTLLEEAVINKLITEHRENPHLRIIQKTLASEVTKMVHSEEDLNQVLEASNILFGKSTADSLSNINEQVFLAVFEGVPQKQLSKKEIEGSEIIDLLVKHTSFLSSNGEARRALKENSISLNKQKLDPNYTFDLNDLINDKYLILQRGKKNFFLAIVE